MSFKITRLKNKAARQLRSYYYILDRYSCGASLAEEISTDLRKAKSAYNSTIRKLMEIDPDCSDKFLLPE